MEDFKETVWEYYRHNKRDLPWRDESFEPYKILVSEIMLQQTQASRVIPKYNEFLNEFPTIKKLASASLGDVLRRWSGLGYNRRAKYLHEAAKQLHAKQDWTTEDLVACKGIGKNTAAAILTYAYNLPMVFIETNIRTVFIHHFYNGHEDVDDKEIIPILKKCLDKEHPRDFYYALMDYGTYLKKSIGNASRQSKHYAKQSRFEGSLRQIRGQVLRELATKNKTEEELKSLISDERLVGVLNALIAEGLISSVNGSYTLA